MLLLLLLLLCLPEARRRSIKKLPVAHVKLFLAQCMPIKQQQHPTDSNNNISRIGIKVQVASADTSETK